MCNGRPKSPVLGSERRAGRTSKHRHGLGQQVEPQNASATNLFSRESIAIDYSIVSIPLNQLGVEMPIRLSNNNKERYTIVFMRLIKAMVIRTPNTEPSRC